ncbi:MAG: hypothetical protein ACLGGZ_07675 [Alphaproteobacteria bacterium]|jgi:hypothetical protein
MSEQLAYDAAQPAPTRAELAYLRRGVNEPGGKLPLFDRRGQEISPAIIRICIANGWAEHWFANPVKPDWLVCRLTQVGREMVQQYWPVNGTED